MMTPCEKLGYKVGDRFEVIDGAGNFPWNVKGTIITLCHDDGSKVPCFSFPCGKVWAKQLDFVRPLKTEAERRGAKFGVGGVVKATGTRWVFSCESCGLWKGINDKGIVVTGDPSHFRLDHEPGYKEIPFSEATDDQRMRVENLVLSGGGKVDGIKKSRCGKYYQLDSDREWSTIYDDAGNAILFSEYTDPASCVLTVRVPA